MNITVTQKVPEIDSRPILRTSQHGRMVVSRADGAVMPLYIAVEGAGEVQHLGLTAVDGSDLLAALADVLGLRMSVVQGAPRLTCTICGQPSGAPKCASCSPLVVKR